MKRIVIDLALPALILSALLLGAGLVAAEPKAPENDASFSLEVFAEDLSVALDELPAGVSPNAGARGVQIADGAVVQQSVRKLDQPGSGCIVAWGVCDYSRTVTGTYADGHVEITIDHKTSVTFDGQPSCPGCEPIVPGTVDLLDKTVITGDYTDNGTFLGETVSTDQSLESKCVEWDDLDGDGDVDDHDVGGICLLDEYFAGADETAKSKTYLWVRGAVTPGGSDKPSEGSKPSAETPTPEPLTVSVLNLTGDIEYVPKGAKDPLPLTADVILKEGDTVSTGFESHGIFRIGKREFIVGQLTYLTINEMFHEKNVDKTILYLKIGLIRVKEKHTDSIRGDFHVATPGANSAPRGTEFIVNVAEDGTTTTYVIDGTVAFEDTAGNSVDIEAGSKASAAEGVAIAGPAPYTPDEIAAFPKLPASSGSSVSLLPIAVGVILVVALLAAGVYFVRRRRRTVQPA